MGEMRKLFGILLALIPSVLWAEGTATLISDNRAIEDSWAWCFSEELGLTVKKETLCYGCNLTAESGMASDVQRILSNKSISERKPDVIFLQLGCNDEADSEQQFTNYEQSLFDFPYGKVCTTKGANPRTKNIAISKDKQKLTNRNFAGSLCRIMLYLREEVPDARVFFLAPVRYGQELHGADSLKVSQLKAVANMFCVPFVEDMQMVTRYDFIWKQTRPQVGTVLLLGDSYCQLKKWTAEMERLAEVQFINLGKVSATLKERGGKHTNTLGAQLNRIPIESKPDAIIIEGGINDDADSQSAVDDYPSRVASQKRTTFAGAMAYIVNNLKKRFPSAKIYVITPGGLYYGHTDRPFDFIIKADQIRKAAQLLGLPTIDWDREGRLSFVFNNSKGTGNGTNASPFLYNVPSRETGDLLHPNEVGAVYLAENVIKELRAKNE